MIQEQTIVIIDEIQGMLAKLLVREVIAEGGPGSGHWGHKGRKGKRGGSTPGVSRKFGIAFGKKLKISDIKMGSYKIDHLQADDFALHAISKVQGFDGRPKVVPKEEFDKLIKKGSKELFRGVKSKHFATEFQEGGFFAGKGAFGSGTYAGKGSSAKLIAKNFAGQDGAIMRMAMRSDAKIAKFRDIAEEMKTSNVYKKEVDSLQKLAFSKENTLMLNHYRVMRNAIGNVGRYAAMLGYDGIEAGVAEFVILNRTKVIVQKELVK